MAQKQADLIIKNANKEAQSITKAKIKEAKAKANLRINFAKSSAEEAYKKNIKKCEENIKKLEDAEVPLATDSKVGGIKIGHEASKGEAAVKLDTDGKAYVEATLYSAKTDGGLQLEDTEFSIKEVSTDLIKNGSNILIINGGSAAE